MDDNADQSMLNWSGMAVGMRGQDHGALLSQTMPSAHASVFYDQRIFDQTGRNVKFSRNQANLSFIIWQVLQIPMCQLKGRLYT